MRGRGVTEGRCAIFDCGVVVVVYAHCLPTQLCDMDEHTAPQPSEYWSFVPLLVIAVQPSGQPLAKHASRAGP